MSILHRLIPALLIAALLAACKAPSSPTTRPTASENLSTVEPTHTEPPTVTVASVPSHTPRPTATQRPTPVPLSDEAIATCPVSSPNLTESPDAYYMPVDSGYSNPEQTLFISLWPEGKVVFYPGGPGEVASDGSMTMKFWFYRSVPGEVVIQGQRLDEPAPAGQLAVLGTEDGYGEVGFHPAGLKFPSQGCWEVTAVSGDQTMTFVTLVVWSPENPYADGG